MGLLSSNVNTVKHRDAYLNTVRAYSEIPAKLAYQRQIKDKDFLAAWTVSWYNKYKFDAAAAFE